MTTRRKTKCEVVRAVNEALRDPDNPINFDGEARRLEGEGWAITLAQAKRCDDSTCWVCHG